MLNKVYFDADSHSYFLDEERTQLVPFYSGIIKEVLGSKFDAVPYDILKAAQEKGTAVHKITQIYDESSELPLNEDYILYLKQWERFKKDFGILGKKFDLIEQPLYCKTLHYGITPDRVIGDTVIEIKTSCQTYKDYRLQTAAQALAYEENYGIKINKRMLVFLTESTYEPEYHENPKDFEFWKSIVKTFQWKMFER